MQASSSTALAISDGVFRLRSVGWAGNLAGPQRSKVLAAGSARERLQRYLKQLPCHPENYMESEAWKRILARHAPFRCDRADREPFLSLCSDDRSAI
jgi:hypothetical protein